MDYKLLSQDIPINNQFDESDVKFLIDNNLIYLKRGLYYSNFVGEVVTPNNNYFSLPKNQNDSNLIDPIKGLLSKYNKNYKHKSLVSNKKFMITKEGDFKSNKYYFDRLSSFFLDFVTYEFIYPYETKKIHSIEPLGGTIDMVSTKINRGIYGDGVTYNITDRSNDESWKLDDIYYSTVISLAKETGSDSDIKEIERMRDYLNEEGYNVNLIDLSDKEFIINEIKKCDVNIVHYPIKNTLLDYFELQLKMIESNYSINVFYTRNFEIVWENILKEILHHNPSDFEQEFLNKFKKVITNKDFVPINTESEWKLRNKNISSYEREGKYIIYQSYDPEPDIFSSYQNSSEFIDGKLKFIGDAKYYNDTRHDFHKEFSTYNDIMDNKYPMVVLVASDRTFIDYNNFRYSVKTGRELIIMDISIIDVIEDYVNGTRNVIDDVHNFIKKRSKRLKNQLK
jgi:hypothetical protein